MTKWVIKATKYFQRKNLKLFSLVTNQRKDQWLNEPLHVIKMLGIKMKNFWFYSPNMGKEYPSAVQQVLPAVRFINLIFIGVLLFLSLKNKHFKIGIE